ncbi:UNVERIFIED_CONTAM: putative membrane protein YhfC [Brevibacillus sp. OAP136]
MIASVTMVSIVIQGLISLLFPIGLFLYMRKKERFTMRPVWVGAAIFLIFTQVFEKVLHLVVLQGNPTIQEHPVVFAVYGALAAGIFEEVGRYIGFSWLLKSYRERKDGLAYGLGHGGFEAIFIGAISSIQAFVFAILINEGRFLPTIGSSMPADMAAALQDQMLSMSSFEFILAGFERIPAIFIQIALSLIVLHAVNTRRKGLVLIAILLHAVIDFVPGLYQGYKGELSIWVAEAVILLFGIAAVWYIRSSRFWSGSEK